MTDVRLAPARQGVAVGSAPQRPTRPVVWWAGVGGFYTLVMIYTLTRWIAGGPKPAPKGPVPLPGYMQVSVVVLQTLPPAAALWVIWRWVIRPWRRDGRPNFDALFVLGCLSAYWWDPSPNYLQTMLTYNAHLINFGSWMSYLPGWLSPNGDRLAEPLLMMGPAYVLMFFGGAVLANFIMRKAKERWPRLSKLGVVGVCFVGLFVLDGIIELVMMFPGVFTYPGAYGTIFTGHYYQFPWWEPLLVSVAWTPWACLRYFKNDRGESFAERGMSELRCGERAKSGVRYLAVIGVMHTAILFYLVPFWVLSLQARSFPQDILKRPYFTSGLCGYGTDFACPGQNVPINRPGAPHLAPDGTLHR